MICPECSKEMNPIDIIDTKGGPPIGNAVYGKTYNIERKYLMQCPKCKTIATEWK